jgi:hypothetical protein
MSDEHFTTEKTNAPLPAVVNTPETLGVTPRFMLQRNALSRGAHDMSSTAQKVIATAMALLPPDLSSLTVPLPLPIFVKPSAMSEAVNHTASSKRRLMNVWGTT